LQCDLDGNPSDIARQRIAVCRDQVDQILKRARLIRAAVFCLLLTVMLMLVCSLCLGISLWMIDFGSIALFPLIAGMLSMMAGIGLVMLELKHALDPVAVEYATLNGPADEGEQMP